MYSIGGPQGPVYFYIDANGFVVSVLGRGANVNGSPVIITPSEPIGPISQIHFGDLYNALLGLLG